MKVKFLAKKDKLYIPGDPIDGIYIIRQGKLHQKVKVDLEYEN